MSALTDYFARAEREEAEALAQAERDAPANGKELFDLARFEALLNRGSQASGERAHRKKYYLLYPELKTLEAYAKMLIEHEPWNDAR